MGQAKEECEKLAAQSRQLEYECERQGDKAGAEKARQNAMDHERARDSWLYRTFGW